MEVNVRADVQAAMKDVAYWQRDAVPKAAARALNRTASAAKQEAIRAVSDEIGGESGRGRKALSRAFTIFNATWTKLVATIYTRGKPIPLIFFDARQTPEGVVANVSGKQITRRGAFIKKIYGAQSVWLRKYRGTGSTKLTKPGALRGRFPVKKLYGPSVASVALSKRVLTRIEAKIREKWPENFRRELQYRLSRFK